MIKKVPREELEALFEVLYNYKPKSQEYENKLFNFYAYKIKKLLNKKFLTKSSLPIKVENFSVSSPLEYILEESPVSSFDIEEKFSFHIYISQQDISKLFKILKNYLILQDESSFYPFLKNELSNVFLSLFEDLKLTATKKEDAFFRFYTDEVLCVSYECKIGLKENIQLKILFDKDFFESENISKYIVQKPTLVERNNLKDLISYISSLG